MGEAERRLNYPMSERTRFRVRVEINEDLSGTPRVEWVRHCLSLEEAQRGYIAAPGPDRIRGVPVRVRGGVR